MHRIVICVSNSVSEFREALAIVGAERHLFQGRLMCHILRCEFAPFLLYFACSVSDGGSYTRADLDVGG